MKNSRKVSAGLVFAMILALAPGPARADACAPADREMAFGEAAVEDAKDAAGFKRAAEQFLAATQKAPRCAAAFYNLGVVEEKAGQYAAAKSAFEKYLSLAPKAADAAEVRKMVFKLEYRIKQAPKQAGQQTAGLTSMPSLAGRWHKEWRGRRVSGYEVAVSVQGKRTSIVAGPAGRPAFRFNGSLSGRRLSGEAQVWESFPQQVWRRGTFDGTVSADGRRMTVKAWFPAYQDPFDEVYVRD